MDTVTSPILDTAVEMTDAATEVMPSPEPDGGGWSRIWIVALVILKFGIPVILAGLGIYALYRYFTRRTRNGTAQATKIANIAETLKAMTPEERQAYMERIVNGK